MQRPIWRYISADAASVQSLRTALSLDSLFCRLLVQRGITDPAEAELFLYPKLEHLHDPFLMRDMEEAIQRLTYAISHNERILLYGDYDVDGTTSVAVMYAFLSSFSKNLDYYLPDREKEGYGVSLEGVAYARKTGCKLVIAMDCGIKAHEAIGKAKADGIDFIVCDHHLPEGELPEAVANLDPLRSDCPYPFKDLSGCGIAFKLAQAFALRNHVPAAELESLLDMVAVSIACDLVPMIGENRILAYFGMRRLNRDPRVGLWALIQRSGRHFPLNINDLVFGIGPMINAAGRLGDARDAVRLLLSADKSSALENAGALVSRNMERREVDFATSDAAKQQFLDRPDWAQRKSIVVFDSAWHKGIIGIAASRVAEHFHRPAVVLTENDGVAIGSARSVPGFDLYEALQQCEDLFISFGGHAHAAGVQLRVENLPQFEARLEALARAGIRPENERPVLNICCDLPLERISLEFWQTLKLFAPFGPHNLHPVFVARNVVDSGRSRVLDNNHVRFSVKSVGGNKIWTGIGFGLAEQFEALRKKPFDLAFSLQEGNVRGEKVLSLMVKALEVDA